jgi:3'5'-cyclic nucleotide phosphodiesterase
VVKLLGRIAPPARNKGDMEFDTDEAVVLCDVASRISSDPLVCFACVFSALIHDVDHPGVPNSQLVEENAKIAETFHGKSVAEQNSVVVAWNLLLEPKYALLRRSLCVTIEEAKRFRQLVVNAVMATDVMARDLKVIRDRRWAQAFATVPLADEVSSVTINRKATVVMEHLLQASDVCHTMQHWHVYRKWNERLFHEMSQAYAAGRAKRNPADIWYQSEMGFFDFYVIPLAKKLADCGVFGVSSDEFLNYARKNRDEWADRGEQVVCEMVAKYQGDVISIDPNVRS